MLNAATEPGNQGQPLYLSRCCSFSLRRACCAHWDFESQGDTGREIQKNNDMGREEEGDIGRDGERYRDRGREGKIWVGSKRDIQGKREIWGGRKKEIQGEIWEERRREIQGDNDTCREGGKRRVKRERLKVERGGK